MQIYVHIYMTSWCIKRHMKGIQQCYAMRVCILVPAVLGVWPREHFMNGSFALS